MLVKRAPKLNRKVFFISFQAIQIRTYVLEKAAIVYHHQFMLNLYWTRQQLWKNIDEGFFPVLRILLCAHMKKRKGKSSDQPYTHTHTHTTVNMNALSLYRRKRRKEFGSFCFCFLSTHTLISVSTSTQHHTQKNEREKEKKKREKEENIGIDILLFMLAKGIIIRLFL